MLKKVFEWLRVVHPKPDSATVEARTKAASDLLTTLDEAKDYELLIAVTSAVVAGFEGQFDSHSIPVQTVVEAIRKYQAAFPSDLSENALELRVTCAIALGELLTRDNRSEEQSPLLAACLLLSGEGVRPAEKRKHLRGVLNELVAEAEKLLEQEAASVRQPAPFDVTRIEKLAPQGDVATFWRELQPALRDCLRALDQRTRSDREELEVLWWLYNGYSTVLGKPLAELPADVAALACGSEVGARVLLPPVPGVAPMVADGAGRGRKKPELAAKKLAKLAAGWDAPVRQLLVPEEKASADLARTAPPLLPLTWLTMRLEESDGAAGWEKEFSRKTGLSPELELTPPALAAQVFREKVAQRIYDETGSGS